MNEYDSFEQKLRCQSVKPLPGSWREEILASTRAAETGIDLPDTSSRHAHGDFPNLRGILRRVIAELVSPGKTAWGSLAAAWVIIAVITLVNWDSNAAPSGATNYRSPLAQELLKEQAQLLAEFSGTSEGDDALPPRRRSAGPRSERPGGYSIV